MKNNKVLLFERMKKINPDFIINENKKIIEFPLSRQATEVTCGVAATQAVARYYGIDRPEDYFKGNGKHRWQTPKEIIDFFEKNKFDVIEKHNMLIDEIKNNVNNKIPTIVLIQAWSENKINYKTNYNNGHWVIVIGYDDNYLYFNDPSISNNIAKLTIKEFENRWHDKEDSKKYIRYGIAIKGKPKYDSNMIQFIK